MEGNRRRAIIFDTDIGTNPDDFFALLLLLRARPSELKLIVTGNRFPFERARFAKRVLEQAGVSSIPVCAGEDIGCVDFFAQKYIKGYKPEIPGDYIESIKKVIVDFGDAVYIVVQGCSNLARFLSNYPTYKDRLDVFHMGATLEGADTDFIKGGTNIEADPLAARFVYESGVRLKVIGSHTTINDALWVTPESAVYRKIAGAKDPNREMLLSHLTDYFERRNIWPALHDPLTTTVALGEDFVDFDSVPIEFNDAGMYRISDKGRRVFVSRKESRLADFMEYCSRNI